MEDALFSAKSMAIMFGNGKVGTDMTSIKKTISFVAKSSGTMGKPTTWEGPGGIVYQISGGTIYDAKGSTVMTTTIGDTYYLTFDMPIENAGVIEISANSFPGTYYVTGDTYARSEKSGKDEFFQFIIEKAKVQSENTITLEAEGDPSVFNMSLRVLRPSNGKMMKLVKYGIPESSELKETAAG